MLKKIILAIIAGVISGLFGAGGGLILVPAFTHIFKLNEKDARGTTIFCILPMVLTAGVFYSTNSFIDWNVAIKSAIGGIIGAYIGSKLMKKLSDKILKITYIVFLIYVAGRYLIS